ncbi:MAG: hypothetical protein WGN25_13190 [Candidatus Electrothrix sp. GW3-4]
MVTQKAPKPSRGFYELIDAVRPASAWIAAPVDELYEVKKVFTSAPRLI